MALETELSLPSSRGPATNSLPNGQPISHSATVDSNTPVSTHSGDTNRSLATPTTGQTSFFPTPSPSELSAPASEYAKHVTFTEHDRSHDRIAQLPVPQTVSGASSGPDKRPNKPEPISFVPPHSRSTARPTLSVKTPSSPQGNSTFASSAVSLLNSLGHHIPSPGEEFAPPRRRSSGMVVPANDTHPHGLRSRTSSHGVQSQASVESTSVPNKRATKQEPYLLRTYKAPRNPRDHAILEVIYSEMLSSRFINISPLSIIQNYLEYHFVGELLTPGEAVP